MTSFVSKLETRLQTKFLRKTQKPTLFRKSFDQTTQHPTDFPIYVQDLTTSETNIPLQQGLSDEHHPEPLHNESPRHDTDNVERPPQVMQQRPIRPAINTNHTPLANSQNRTKKQRNRRKLKPKSYSTKKAPIRLDTSTVINISNVDLTEDKILLLSRGLTFYPSPRYIDWTQVKADIIGFSRRL